MFHPVSRSIAVRTGVTSVKLPSRVKLVEVGPRDGLQNERGAVSIECRVELIDRLSACGFPVIEAGSFVSPERVPQMAASGDVLAKIRRRPGVAYPVLVPNLQGFEAALSAGATEIAVFTAASETFSQENTQCSIAESLVRLDAVCVAAKRRQVPTRAYVSCVLGCPYEGAVNPERVAEVASRLLRMGCDEISLGDTIGVGTPGRVQALIGRVAEFVPLAQLAVHFHDTYGQALANILAALDAGVRTVDGAVGGLGGCPYAPGAGGNVASEDVLYMLDGLGIETGVDLDRVVESAQFITGALGHPLASKVSQARLASRLQACE